MASGEWRVTSGESGKSQQRRKLQLIRMLGEGTNLNDHNHQRSVMTLLIDYSDSAGVLKISTT